MKILMINAVCGTGSTGRICTDLAKQFEAEGHEVKIAYGRGNSVAEQFEKYAVRIGNDFDVNLHGIYTRLFDAHGFGSIRATKKFLQWADAYDPDLVWLHNLHGYYINIELLFRWIKSRTNMQVKWTLHDCWAFTGHCSHFIAVGCQQWQDVCRYCEQKKEYPVSIFDRCKQNFERKRKAFTGVANMQIVTPSKWLANLVKRSFLQEYPITVKYNNIDKDIFCPSPSDFRSRYQINDKKIILGVAAQWRPRKGFADFLKLSKCLNNDMVIVMVGLTKQQVDGLPPNIIGIQRTNSPKELAEIYTAADVFFNPTYEDNYPTVNLEAQACGTKVVTYDTGGAAETLYREDAVAVKTGDLQAAIEQMV